VIGLTLFEISEEVDARWDGDQGKFVKARPPKPSPKICSYAAYYPDCTSKQWLPSGRLGEDAHPPLVGRVHALSQAAIGPGTTWKQPCWIG
jgi:hypothetical protein